MRVAHLSIAVLVLAAACSTGAAATFTFSGAGDGSTWSDPANWVGGQVPATTADGENAADVDINGGYAIVITADVSAIRSLTLSANGAAEPTVTVQPGVTLRLQSIDILNGGLILGAPGQPATITWSKSNRGHLICEAGGYIAGTGTITTFAGAGGVQLLSERADALDMTAITLAMKYHECLRIASADLGRSDSANWSAANLCIGNLTLLRDDANYTLAGPDGERGTGTNALYCEQLTFTGEQSRLNINGLNVFVRDRATFFDGSTVEGSQALTVAAAFNSADAKTSLYDPGTPRATAWVGVGISPPKLNQPPVVSAGGDQTITLPATASLTGVASDDGLPAGATLTYAWSVDNGPAAVGFAPVDAAISSASFTAPGTYVLRLTVDDGAATGSATVTVTVEPSDEPITYYVDRNHASASDANPGSEEAPWLTVGHAVASVSPGDSIYVKEGVYRESVALSVSGLSTKPITLAGYPGHRAVLSGADEVTGWTPCTESIAKGNANWASMVYADIDYRPAELYQDGVRVEFGRSPSVGWWNVETNSANATSLTDSAHLNDQAGSYWTGGQLFIWRLDATQQYIRDITASAPGSLTFDALKYNPVAGDRYYIRNKIESITSDGQWACEQRPDGIWRVVLWPRGNADPAGKLFEAVNPARGSFVLGLHKQGYWVIDNLEIRHSAGHGAGSWSEPSIGHVTIKNCAIHHNQGAGIYGRTNAFGIYRRNYVAYNGGIDDVGISTGPTGVVVEENEIAHNGKDGLRIEGEGIVVRRNFIHGHWFWQHADNMQTDGGARNVLVEQNFVLNGGQNYMMANVAGLTFRENVVVGSRGNMLIFGHDSVSGATLTGNTFLFPGGSVMDTSGGDGYFIRDNIAVSGKLAGFWSASSTMQYDSDYNLFCFAEGLSDLDYRVVLWDANWTSRGLAEYVNASGQDTHSRYGYPLFANAPRRYVLSDGSRLNDLTETRTYIDPANTTLFAVGDHIELDWDGVVRTVTAVGADFVEFEPAEARLRMKAPAICLWDDKTNYQLDLSFPATSPAAGTASDGGNIGSPINTVQFARGDFDGDGVRDIPSWLEDPAPRVLGTDIPGDADRDGDVDLNDFVTLKTNFGAAPATWAQGDFNGDGAITLDDFAILKTHFGTVTQTDPAPAAPAEAEPARQTVAQPIAPPAPATQQEEAADYNVVRQPRPTDHNADELDEPVLDPDEVRRLRRQRMQRIRDARRNR